VRKTTFSSKWPPHPRAEGGQVEPVLGSGGMTVAGSGFPPDVMLE